MALPWTIYAFVVVFGATGIHFFSKLAKGSFDPFIALVYTMGAGFLVSLLFLFQANDSFLKSLTEIKSIALYAVVGLCITIAHIGIFQMFNAGAPMNVATPLVRFAPAVFAVLLGTLFFHESLKLHHIFGLVLAVAGFYLLTKS